MRSASLTPGHCDMTQLKQPVPYPSNESFVPRVNMFEKKSCSTQEYVPCNTSSELSKAIMKMRKEHSSRNDSEPHSSKRYSAGSYYEPMPQGENRSVLSITQSGQNPADKKYKAKCKRYLKKIKALEQVNSQLEFKVKFFEEK